MRRFSVCLVNQVFVRFNFVDSVGGHLVQSFSEVVLTLVWAPFGIVCIVSVPVVINRLS